MDNLIFKNWKARCSSLGHIMTNLPQPITTEELSEKANLEAEKETGVNENGRKTKWTDTKQKRLNTLVKKQSGEDELPAGALTHLDDVFRAQFWGRRRTIHNKFLEKGNLCEDDAIGLLSKTDNAFYMKNKEQFESTYLQGSMDIRTPLFDTKTNWDFDTFDKADMTPLYNYQLKGYEFMLKELGLRESKGGTLAYCLVNAPIHQIQNEKTSLFYKFGRPDDENEEWTKALRQMERNMIFDVERFQKEYPFYPFENKDLNFTIPPVFRVKKFSTELTDEDEVNIATRVTMARIYLCQKELEVYEKCPELKYKAVEYYEKLNQTV